MRPRRARTTAILRGAAGASRSTVIASAPDQSRYLSAIVEATPDFVSMSRADGQLLYMNAAGRRLAGIPDDVDITSMNYRRLCPDWVSERLEREWLPQATRDGASSGEGAIRTLDGREIPVAFALHVHRAADGSIDALSTMARDITAQARAKAEHRETEQQLRRSEERFRALVEQSPFSVQVLDAGGQTLRVNRAWEQLWGATIEILANYNILEDQQLEARGVLPLIRRAFAGEVVHIPPIEYNPDQTIPDSSWHEDPRRWVAAVAYPLKDNEGRVREVVLVHEDVTARTRAERALRESDEQFRLMADTIPQLTWMARPDGYIFWYNRRWYDYTGTTPADMEGWGWQRVHDPDVLPRVMERWQASIATGEPFDMVFPLRGADGCLRPFLTRVNPLRDESGAVTRWFGTNTDISEQKRAEDASRFLAEVSSTLASVTDYHDTLQQVAQLAVPRFADWCAVDIVEPDGTLRRVAAAHVDPSKLAMANDLAVRYCADVDAPVAASRVASTGQSELVTTVTEEMLERDARDPEHLRMLRVLGARSSMAVAMRTADRTLGVISFASAESGRRFSESQLALAEQLAGRAAVAIDNARLYAELRDADRRKDEFLAMLAHELRNPLAPIRTSLEILKMPAVDRGMLERFRLIMERQVHHLVRLVDDLLDVSRVMRAKVQLRREPVSIDSVIAQATDTVRPALDAQAHQLTVSIATPPPVVDADPVRLGQVISNLLTNAAKYTPRGGRIEIHAGLEDGLAVIRVSDDGIGIAPELLPRVFDLFVQGDDSMSRAQGGLGIGLTLVKNIVELHGGSVQGRSAGPGQGSEFTVRLPVSSTAPHWTPAPQADSPPAGGARRVLVVDDNVDGAETLAMMMRLMGHMVYVAHDGRGALAASSDFQPDTVLLDLGMPGMDGYQVARELRAQPAGQAMRIVAVTGWGQEQDRQRTAAAGFDAHLVKPIEPAAIEKMLRATPSP